MEETEDSLEIPSPAELAKQIEKEHKNKEQNKIDFTKKLLKDSEIAELLLGNRYRLIDQHGEVNTEIVASAEKLAGAGLKIGDLIAPIKEFLKQYDVAIEEKATSLELTISVPEIYFEEEAECK